MRFSVIIPVYNKADTIASTIESVLAQTIDDYEIIAVNDGSTDDIFSAVEPYMDRIKLISQQNAGVSAARNSGIDVAEGEFVCFLDADDRWKPQHLEALNDAIEKYPQEKFFSTLFVAELADGTTRSKLDRTAEFESIQLIDDYFAVVLQKSTLINTSTVCIKRELLSVNRFELGEKIGEDTDLWYRIAAYNDLVLVKAETAVYCMGNSTATASGTNNLRWRFAQREQELLSDAGISERKKTSISVLVDRWRCTCSRELLLCGKDDEAKEYIKGVHNKDSRYLVSKMLLAMPFSLRARTMKLLNLIH